MAKGFKHGAGGGTSLNFKVVGNPQPENPKKNIIWVDTDVPITSWIFSATQPETATEGMVWISIGTSSYTDFNALKKNGIMVYPLAVKQYIGGAWVGKSAKIYQGGAWVDLRDGELYYNGEEYTDITGGWVEKFPPSDWYSPGKVEKLDNHIRLYCDNTRKFISAETVLPVDLSNVNTLKVNVTTKGIVGRFAVNDTTPVSLEKSKARKDITGVGVCSLDVSSLNGTYYIAVMGWGDSGVGELVFDKVRME